MHAFDLDKLAGRAIVVRRARAGESLKTLDGKTRTLTADMLVIADAERAQAIGGVMGGADSEVSAGTTRIVFEAAWFQPASVRATSKKLGLKTEASTRFERGDGSDRAGAGRWRAPASCWSRSAPARAADRSSTSTRRRSVTQVKLERRRIAGTARHGRARRRGRADPHVARVRAGDRQATRAGASRCRGGASTFIGKSI